ncbi:uncharacterized protein BKA55DRAFT_582918 [Fusarium redolens]|uniref:Uncharacterized protein n=1 Tax=Fusarium redolens TaxID=48865 RepID=A0A9P9JMI4_FUSRE|nr:uncharacterized protein BKA55DRAFT_582918 [Fusarium redolens]KAH7230472.1 hypothetical protein BKA55DRAFT_582918 [Fusarium redolens]
MAPKTLTSLPSEIRQQIFKECLKVDGGYVYNVQTDKLTNADKAHTAIDLSLRYTCRSIANDTRIIPLAVNTIHFSTVFRQDWCSLAGCFNLAAATYYVLEQDFVLHLAEFITPEMIAEVESMCPRFEALLEIELARHQMWMDENTEREIFFEGDNLRPSLCSMVRQFLKKVDLIEAYGLKSFSCPFRSIENAIEADPSWGEWNRPWDKDCGEVRVALSHCLQLIANEHPNEFANCVYASLPQWVGKYSAQDFLKIRFNLWDIPSQEEVTKTLALLDIADFVWELADMWHYAPRGFYENIDTSISQGRLAPEFDKPDSLLEQFDIRCREKLRFSATAAAIRFLKRLGINTRTQVRRLALHEDLPSVNVPSLHAKGLVPLFKENLLLRVERRVNVFGCLASQCPQPRLAAIHINKVDVHREIVNWDFDSDICSWLLDALAVADSGLPTKCFTFFLEAGSYGEYCEDIFQRAIHTDIASSKAWNICLETGLLASLRPTSLEERTAKYAMDPRFGQVIEHLVNQTSIFRCDFNPGVPLDVDTLVEDAKVRHGERISDKWVSGWGDVSFPIPHDIYHDVMVAPNFEFQTRQEYIQSRGGNIKTDNS